MTEKIKNLYNDDRIWAAFYRDGKNLGEICKDFNCGVYDLTPWLTKPLTNSYIEQRPIERDN